MIFVDTSFFFALASTKDPDHKRVRAVFDEFDPEKLSELWLTTNHVVFESITLARTSLHHRAAVEMGERLYDESMARIHWATPDRELQAFDYLRGTRDPDAESNRNSARS